MKKELFDQVTVKVEDDAPCDMKLTYYLLTGAVCEEYCDLNVYGVEIEKEITSGINTGIERKMIKDLFFKKCEAIKFLELISKNTVTPIELKYVIKEYVCQQIEELAVKNA